VCFDDFERLSPSIKLEEVLGFIAELKEQKECKVVMILNEGKLGDNKETLDNSLNLSDSLVSDNDF
jgi:hypothetical protein